MSLYRIPAHFNGEFFTIDHRNLGVFAQEEPSQAVAAPNAPQADNRGASSYAPLPEEEEDGRDGIWMDTDRGGVVQVDDVSGCGQCASVREASQAHLEKVLESQLKLRQDLLQRIADLTRNDKNNELLKDERAALESELEQCRANLKGARRETDGARQHLVETRALLDGTTTKLHQAQDRQLELQRELRELSEERAETAEECARVLEENARLQAKLTALTVVRSEKDARFVSFFFIEFQCFPRVSSTIHRLNFSVFA